MVYIPLITDYTLFMKKKNKKLLCFAWTLPVYVIQNLRVYSIKKIVKFCYCCVHFSHYPLGVSTNAIFYKHILLYTTCYFCIYFFFFTSQDILIFIFLHYYVLLLFYWRCPPKGSILEEIKNNFPCLFCNEKILLKGISLMENMFFCSFYTQKGKPHLPLWRLLLPLYVLTFIEKSYCLCVFNFEERPEDQFKFLSFCRIEIVRNHKK